MAKRFTDTEKWIKPWFRSLPNEARLVWIYMLDNCDHAGIWPADFELLSFQMRTKIDEETLVGWFGDKLTPLPGGKYFIPSFVEFQYGTLQEDNRAHKSVMLILEKEGAYKVLGSPIQGRKDKDKDKDTDKDKDNALDFEFLFAEYPRRKGDQGKKRALAKCKRDFSSGTKYDALLVAVRNYRRHCDQEGKTGTEYVKQFSTFVNGAWEEWLKVEAVPTAKNESGLSGTFVKVDLLGEAV